MDGAWGRRAELGPWSPSLHAHTGTHTCTHACIHMYKYVRVHLNVKCVPADTGMNMYEHTYAEICEMCDFELHRVVHSCKPSAGRSGVQDAYIDGHTVQHG